MNVPFGPDMAQVIAEKAGYVHMAGRELALFGEREPWLSGDCGVQIDALEARTLVMSGAPMRAQQAALEAARLGRPFLLAAADVEALSRLEAVIVTASSKIAQKQAMLEAADGPVNTIGQVLGLAGMAANAIGIFRQIVGH